MFTALVETFIDSTRLLDTLAELNGILVGQFVLSMIDPSGREHYDRVDIVVSAASFYAFIEYLEQQEHARLVTVVAELPGLSQKAHHTILDFALPRGAVRLVRSATPNPFLCVPHFYSTHLMNVLTHDRLIVGYPTLTFRCQGILTEDHYPVENERISFDVGGLERMIPNHSCVGCVACPNRWRILGDRECAEIVFREAAVPRARLSVKWKLGGGPCTTAA